ncbi:murein L,D-transpeptidase family protein [Pedobacter foliorum]|uniref:L,D-transpeptidase family protein n=1 Tax=Pedobacter foliorum TaxID=2739058 RepID=UPI001565A1A7|nr:L,D-transpeptidase family protein [Pedobacter foliorum]NRF39918.1 L,D-transpeptidase family protein [Pedobacter foliorum]
MSIPTLAQSSFKTQQLTFERVREAYDVKWENLQKELAKEQITGKFILYIAAYKAERRLEIWLKQSTQKQYKLFKVYPFCTLSGVLGPKLKEGDLQTPEGFYHIAAFNPKSNFHLSLGINYPNSVDLLRSANEKPGNHIYIHGNCVTVGCIPLTDEKIKEVYILAVEARNSGQNEIPVHIFPFKITDANLNKHLSAFPQYKAFWTNLQQGYAYFKKYRQVPDVTELMNTYQFK